MKLSHIALTIALATAVAGPAAAMVSANDVTGSINQAVTSGNVHVVVDGSEATLFGWVDDAHSKQAAAQAALSLNGIDSVRNRIFESHFRLARHRSDPPSKHPP